MPTSSQSRILSVVDQQLQQQTTVHDGTSIHPTASNIEPKRGSARRKDEENQVSPGPATLSARRRSSLKINENQNISRTSQRNDSLHVPIDGNLRPKTSIDSSAYRRTSWNAETPNYRLNEFRMDTTPAGHNSSESDFGNDNDEEEDINPDQRPSVLNENARRLLVLGTIRPSRTFYRDLPAADIEHLMEYFQKMRNSNRKMTSEEINQELSNKSVEYKPKMFFDSTVVSKRQVNEIEKLLEPYAEKIRNHQAELIRLDNPFHFLIKSTENDSTLIALPRDYNDCLLTLINRSDPLRNSELISGLVSEKLVEEVKSNSLDISYFPGGVNYDVPHDDIDENGQMNLETYEKLKQRLRNRKIWYFPNQPEKKPNALIAVLPLNHSHSISHQQLLDCLYDRLKSSSNEQNLDVKERILSIEFVPLSCILDSFDIPNQFVIDCDGNETKKELIEKPLKVNLNKQSITIELLSYDEVMRKEYEKSIKAEKYRQLVKNHDQAVKRVSGKK